MSRILINGMYPGVANPNNLYGVNIVRISHPNSIKLNYFFIKKIITYFSQLIIPRAPLKQFYIYSKLVFKPITPNIFVNHDF